VIQLTSFEKGSKRRLHVYNITQIRNATALNTNLCSCHLANDIALF